MTKIQNTVSQNAVLKNTALQNSISIIIFLFIIIFLTGNIIAQEGNGQGRLKGFVLDTDKNPIIGAKVSLEYIKYNKKIETITDNKGKFSFLGLGVGVIKISAEKDGFVIGGNQTRVSGAQRNPTQYIKLKKLSELKAKDDPNAKVKDEFSQAINLFDNEKFDKALELFLSFRQKKPDMYKVGLNIGNCYLELKKYNEAINEFNKVLEKIKTENPELKGSKTASQIFASIGDIYMRQDNLKNAEKYFKKSIEIDQSDHALAYNIAEILFLANKTDDAIKYYYIAIKIKPDWSKSYKQIGYAFLNKGNTKKAIEMFKIFLKLDAKSSDAQIIRDVIKSLGE